jgi:hypothetical protein
LLFSEGQQPPDEHTQIRLRRRSKAFRTFIWLLGFYLMYRFFRWRKTSIRASSTSLMVADFEKQFPKSSELEGLRRKLLQQQLELQQLEELAADAAASQASAAAGAAGMGGMGSMGSMGGMGGMGMGGYGMGGYGGSRYGGY